MGIDDEFLSKTADEIISSSDSSEEIDKIKLEDTLVFIYFCLYFNRLNGMNT